MTQLPLVRLLYALALDCEATDGWQDAAPTVAEAATLIGRLVAALENIASMHGNYSGLAGAVARDALAASGQIRPTPATQNRQELSDQNIIRTNPDGGAA